MAQILSPFSAKSNLFHGQKTGFSRRRAVLPNREQPLERRGNQTLCSGTDPANSIMATYKDPTQCFAPLEVIERLLEIRSELGFSETLYMVETDELTDLLDAFGFDIYAFTTESKKINYGDYTAPVVPGGDALHTTLKAH